uniref:Uncharacterized protein n=1 Tax=Porodaedalea pini TaxID=108901 RepID=A0A5B9RB18_9AGAM|nr:hypothetical protein PPIT_000128 [Porodaedalea pini]QEG57024.1 hypothetical protein PPIT_000128 [Porodaedalea pini]
MHHWWYTNVVNTLLNINYVINSFYNLFVTNLFKCHDTTNIFYIKINNIDRIRSYGRFYNNSNNFILSWIWVYIIWSSLSPYVVKPNLLFSGYLIIYIGRNNRIISIFNR